MKRIQSPRQVLDYREIRRSALTRAIRVARGNDVALREAGDTK